MQFPKMASSLKETKSVLRSNEPKEQPMFYRMIVDKPKKCSPSTLSETKRSSTAEIAVCQPTASEWDEGNIAKLSQKGIQEAR